MMNQGWRDGSVVKCMNCKPQDLSSDPQYSYKETGMGIPVLRGRDRKILRAHQFSQMVELQVQWKKPVSKIKMQSGGGGDASL